MALTPTSIICNIVVKACTFVFKHGDYCKIDQFSLFVFRRYMSSGISLMPSKRNTLSASVLLVRMSQLHRNFRRPRLPACSAAHWCAFIRVFNKTGFFTNASRSRTSSHVGRQRQQVTDDKGPKNSACPAARAASVLTGRPRQQARKRTYSAKYAFKVATPYHAQTS